MQIRKLIPTLLVTIIGGTIPLLAGCRAGVLSLSGGLGHEAGTGGNGGGGGKGGKGGNGGNGGSGGSGNMHHKDAGKESGVMSYEVCVGNIDQTGASVLDCRVWTCSTAADPGVISPTPIKFIVRQ